MIIELIYNIFLFRSVNELFEGWNIRENKPRGAGRLEDVLPALNVFRVWKMIIIMWVGADDFSKSAHC